MIFSSIRLLAVVIVPFADQPVMMPMGVSVILLSRIVTDETLSPPLVPAPLAMLIPTWQPLMEIPW